MPKGENHRSAKLTNEDVINIRQKYIGKYGQIKELAEKYHISWGVMFRVVHRITWRSVE